MCATVGWRLQCFSAKARAVTCVYRLSIFFVHDSTTRYLKDPPHILRSIPVFCTHSTISFGVGAWLDRGTYTRWRPPSKKYCESGCILPGDFDFRFAFDPCCVYPALSWKSVQQNTLYGGGGTDITFFLSRVEGINEESPNGCIIICGLQNAGTQCAGKGNFALDCTVCGKYTTLVPLIY